MSRDTELLIAGHYENSLKYAGLKAVVKDLLGVELDKGLQTSDWSSINSKEQLQYALKDSEILIKHYSVLKDKLEAAGLSRVAQRLTRYEMIWRLCVLKNGSKDL